MLPYPKRDHCLYRNPKTFSEGILGLSWTLVLSMSRCRAHRPVKRYVDLYECSQWGLKQVYAMDRYCHTGFSYRTTGIKVHQTAAAHKQPTPFRMSQDIIYIHFRNKNPQQRKSMEKLCKTELPLNMWPRAPSFSGPCPMPLAPGPYPRMGKASRSSSQP